MEGSQDHDELNGKQWKIGITLVDDDSRWTYWAKRFVNAEGSFMEQVVLYSPLPEASWVKRGLVERLLLPPYGNSNSYARELVDRTGLRPAYERAIRKRGGSPWVPGWDTDPWQED